MACATAGIRAGHRTFTTGGTPGPRISMAEQRDLCTLAGSSPHPVPTSIARFRMSPSECQRRSSTIATLIHRLPRMRIQIAIARAISNTRAIEKNENMVQLCAHGRRRRVRCSKWFSIKIKFDAKNVEGLVPQKVERAEGARV